MAVFILHLFMWLSHTKAFLFGRSSSHAKKESWLSPLTQSSVFIYCFLGGYFSLQGIYMLPLASQAANSASNQNVFDVFDGGIRTEDLKIETVAFESS